MMYTFSGPLNMACLNCHQNILVLTSGSYLTIQVDNCTWKETPNKQCSYIFNTFDLILWSHSFLGYIFNTIVVDSNNVDSIDNWNAMFSTFDSNVIDSDIVDSDIVVCTVDNIVKCWPRYIFNTILCWHRHCWLSWHAYQVWWHKGLPSPFSLSTMPSDNNHPWSSSLSSFSLLSTKPSDNNQLWS